MEADLYISFQAVETIVTKGRVELPKMMLNRIVAVQEPIAIGCDATADDMSNAAGQ